MAKYNTDIKDGESLDQYYRRLAKTADQRLVRLEKLATQKHYKGVEKYAYARAQRDIAAWSGVGATRFNTAPPKNTNQLKAKINDIRTFLEAGTSTKTGIVSIYKQRARTTNERYGTDFTWQDLANYFESKARENIDEKQYGSKTLIQAIGSIKSLGNKKNDIDEAIAGNIKLSDDEIVNGVAKELLKSGYTSKNLFK